MISAIIVSYDSAGCIADCLTSVRQGLPNAEIVVVDNDSRDGTLEVARRTMDDVRLISLDENVGFGRACNVGAEVAAGPHLLFLNPDTRVLHVDRDALARLVTRRPFGLAAPAFDDEPERRRAEAHWLPELLTHTSTMLRPREWRGPRVRHSSDGTRAWVSAAILLVARDEFLTIGGFDPRFFLYYEDRDLSRRYREAGFPVETTDAIRATHEGGASSAHDGLRAAPIGWGLLGWIQYVSIYDGARAASRSARSALLLLRAMRAALRALGPTGWARASRKARQLDEVLQFLAARADSTDARFCPDALNALRGPR